MIGFIIWNRTLQSEIKHRKRIERDLKLKNEEKEVLLKEVHHRVKNNLQIVHSLLNMQARRVEDELTLKVLSESKSRVMAMAIIHKILYESDDLSTIDIEKNMHSLVKNVERIYKKETNHITINVSCKAVFLDIEKAIPVGLIVNELLSNSFKHAFVGKDSGNISIEITLESGTCNFSYEDDGGGVTYLDMESYTT